MVVVAVEVSEEVRVVVCGGTTEVEVSIHIPRTHKAKKMRVVTVEA